MARQKTGRTITNGQHRIKKKRENERAAPLLPCFSPARCSPVRCVNPPETADGAQGGCQGSIHGSSLMRQRARGNAGSRGVRPFTSFYASARGETPRPGARTRNPEKHAGKRKTASPGSSTVLVGDTLYFDARPPRQPFHLHDRPGRFMP